MIQLSEFLPPRPEESWKLIRQVGVDTVVGVLNGAEQDQRMFASVGAGGWKADDRDEVPWSEAALAQNIATYDDHGFTLVALEDTAPIDKARLGIDGRDEQIDQVITQVRAMGRLGIPTLAYNWMALSSWGRTDIAIADRGGALVTGYDREDAQSVGSADRGGRGHPRADVVGAGVLPERRRARGRGCGRASGDASRRSAAAGRPQPAADHELGRSRSAGCCRCIRPRTTA